MRKLALGLVLAAALAGLAAVAATRGGSPSAAGASSHREAPLISQDPTADNTDIYAFALHKAPAKLKTFRQSGCPDLNRGPLVPQTSALTRLRHTPYAGKVSAS